MIPGDSFQENGSGYNSTGYLWIGALTPFIYIDAENLLAGNHIKFHSLGPVFSFVASLAEHGAGLREGKERFFLFTS